MRFTKNTRQILDFIDEYRFITAKQCANIFYKGRKLPLIQAQKKLKLLYDNGVIKRNQDKYTNRHVRRGRHLDLDLRLCEERGVVAGGRRFP